MQEKSEIVMLSNEDLEELELYLARDPKDFTKEEAEHFLEIVDRAA